MVPIKIHGTNNNHIKKNFYNPAYFFSNQKIKKIKNCG